MVPKNRPPTHAGEILLEEFLKPKKMTQVQLAELMGVPVQRVNTLIAGKRGVTAETALLLSRVFETSAEFWMNLQTACDLFEARKAAHRRAG
jgi:antitoxin HigA-1